MPEVPLDEHGRIAGDVVCVGCDYNLRGLQHESACPECGMDVELSTLSDFGERAHPRWLKGIANAGAVAALTFTAMPLCLFAAMATTFHTGLMSRTDAEVTFVMVGGPLVLFIHAMWTFTAKEPSPWMDRTSEKYRKWARLLGLLVAVAFAIVAPVFLLRIGWVGFRFRAGLIMSMFLLSALATVVFGKYARRLALRIPSRRLVVQTRIASAICLTALLPSSLCLVNPLFGTAWSSVVGKVFVEELMWSLVPFCVVLIWIAGCYWSAFRKFIR